MYEGKGSFRRRRGAWGWEGRVHVGGGVFYVRLNQLVFNPLFLPDNNKRLTAAAKNNTIIITRPFRVRFHCRRHRRRRRFHIIKYYIGTSDAARTIIAHVVISPEKRSVTMSLRSLFHAAAASSLLPKAASLTKYFTTCLCDVCAVYREYT